MTTQELRIIRKKIQQFDEAHTTRVQCLEALQQAGIATKGGRLAEPYRSAAQPTKKK